MIRINDDYVVIVDQYNYTLSRDLHKTDKDGQPTYRRVSYHTDLSGALKAFRREYVRLRLKDGCMSLSQAVNTILASNAKVAQIIEDSVGGLT